MEVLLLTSIPGVGKKNDLLVVANGFALNHLLPARKALVVTPNVRKRYALQIKQRALEREHERELASSVKGALSGKVVHIFAKVTKTGKLYAAVSPEAISEAMKKEYAIEFPAEAISIKEHIKTVGNHTVSVTIGAETTTVGVEVKAEEEAKEKKRK